jgi:hypothetical protein
MITMSGYDPDRNWLKEYCIGQMTGVGRGIYGEIGNQQYRDEQHRKRQNNRWSKPPASGVPAVPATRARRVRAQPAIRKTEAASPRAGPEVAEDEKPWSDGFALIGFFFGGGIVYAQPDPSLSVAFLVGLIGMYVAGRFYQLLLLAGVVGLILWGLGSA